MKFKIIKFSIPVKFLILLVLLLVPFANLQAQKGVGISTSSLSKGAIFEMDGKWGGILIPRIPLNSLTDDITVPGTKTNGTLLYNTGTAVLEGFYYWQNNRWNALKTTISNLYNNNGALTANRVVDQQNHYFEIMGNTGRSALSLKSASNFVQQGIAFRNNDNNYIASIYMEASNSAPLRIATGGLNTNVGTIATTLTFNDDRSIVFNSYGSNNYARVPAQILGVNTQSNLTEQPFSSINDNIYTTDGTLTADRSIEMNGNALILRNSENRNLEIQPADPSSPDSPFIFFTNNAVDFKVKGARSLQIFGGYRIRANQYGSGNRTGQPRYLLAVETDGDVIELGLPATGLQFYSYAYPPKPTPNIADTETNLLVSRSGSYLGVLDFNNGAKDAMQPQPAQDGFLIKITGTYTVKNAGTFAFSSNSDDGARVYVDGSLILDAWQESGNIRGDGTVFLSKGKHKFAFYYYENRGGEFFTFRWEANPDGLTGTMRGSQFTIE